MIGNQPALIKREIWEHRSIYVTPLAIASIVTLGTLAMLMFAGGFRQRAGCRDIWGNQYRG